jgi:choline monooxygenase
VGAQNLLGKAGSTVYQRWHEQMMQYRQGESPSQAAIWLT